MEDEEPISVSHEIVFNDLNVDQLRGHLAYIEANLSSTADKQEATSVGLMSRASGVVSQDICPLRQNGDGTRLSIGAGSLTSSTYHCPTCAKQ